MSNKRSKWLQGLLDAEVFIFREGVPAALNYFSCHVEYSLIGYTSYNNGWKDALQHHKFYIKGEQL